MLLLRVLCSPPEHVSFGTHTKDSLGYMRSRARARASTPLKHGWALKDQPWVWVSAGGHGNARDGQGAGPRGRPGPPSEHRRSEGSRSKSRAQQSVLAARARGDRTEACRAEAAPCPPCAFCPSRRRPRSLAMCVPVRREALQAAPRGPPGADSPSGLVLLSQSQASTMRVKERCGRGEAASGSSSLPSPLF